MHTVYEGDKRLAELWDKHAINAGWACFASETALGKSTIRKFASDLVDDKFQQLQMERDRLKHFEIAFGKWSDKTDWVQDSPDTRFAFSPIGMHRADVMRKHIENLEAELATLKAANTPEQEQQPAESEEERAGREMWREWADICGHKLANWAFVTDAAKNNWIAFAKRRPKVAPPAPKMREPGQVLCDVLHDYLCPWRDRNDKQQLNAIAIALGIEAQP